MTSTKHPYCQSGYDSAFPLTQEAYAGLSKRELFAAMAMQGLLACTIDAEASSFAKGAVEAADALIAELAKQGK